MSILKDLIALGGLVGRLFGLKPGPRVERIIDTHWYPPQNTAPGFHVGPNVCFWCLRRDPNNTLVTNPPCPRRRPDTTELA